MTVLCRQDYTTIAEVREWLAIFHKDKLSTFDALNEEDKLFVSESILRVKEQLSSLKAQK